jgi:tripartite ATP-independent transporter DctP family solute receptor
MRSCLRLVGLSAALLALVPCGCGRKSGKIVLRAADVHPLGYPTTEGLRFMAKQLERESGGRITMQIHPASQLGAEKETIEMTKLGTLDINRVSAAPLAEFCKELGVYSLPYLFRDSEHQWKVLGGPIGRDILDKLSGYGFVGLCYYDSGARSFYNSRRPIRTPADLRGLKIRVQKNKIMIDCVEALGASATPMSFEEVYSALQTGVIDGAENNPPSYLSESHYEVAKYYSLDEHTRIPEVVIASAKTWERLSPEDRALVKKAAEASVAEQRRLWDEYTQDAMAKLGKARVKINVPDKAPFRESTRKVYQRYRRDYGALAERIAGVK